MSSHVIIEKIIQKEKIAGYFLTIGDHVVENRWAVTESELKLLKEKLNKMFHKYGE